MSLYELNAKRLRANALINMRVDRGLMVRPGKCQRCNQGCKPDAHHPDYDRPTFIVWLCRSCHSLSQCYPHIRLEVDALAVEYPRHIQRGPRPAPKQMRILQMLRKQFYEVGQTSLDEVAREQGVDHQCVHEQVRALIGKGLVTAIPYGPKKLKSVYIPTDCVPKLPPGDFKMRRGLFRPVASRIRDYGRFCSEPTNSLDKYA